ncbi:elongation factor G [Alicycliphilus sp. B1]|nr:elongation factor G [Alicycliphilus sp. B1]
MEATDAPSADIENAQANLQRELEDEESEPGFILMRGYRTHDPSPRLLGNQMAMAFPQPVSDERVIHVIGDPPLPRPANFSQLHFSARTEYLAQIQFFHHVFQAHVDFVHKVVAIVRASFLFRDPRSRDVMAFIWSLVSGAMGRLPRLSGTGGGGGLGILVVGPSGVGKTSIVDRIVAYLRPKARIHLSLGGRAARWMQLGVVRIAVGHTWHETLMSILAEADHQMQMDRYVREGRLVRRGELQGLVWRTLTSHFCPLLVLDEFQMLGTLQKDEALRILKGLVELMEQLGIPVMVVGTEAVRHLFASFPNYMEKFSNEGLTEFSILMPADVCS